MNILLLQQLLENPSVHSFLNDHKTQKFDPLKSSAKLKNFNQEERLTLLAYLQILPKVIERFQTQKFLLCDSLAWQQSSGWEVSQYKSQSIPTNSTVLDLCCGMGGDAFFLPKPKNVIGVDLSPERLQMYTWNMKAFGHSHEVLLKDVNSIKVTCDVMFLDPDRRTVSKDKNWDLDSMSPNLSQVKSLLNKYPNAMIKLPPAANPDSFWGELPIAAEYIGSRRDCRELLLKTGTFSKGHNTVEAVLLPDNHRFSATPQEISEAPRRLSISHQYIIEPYKPLIRSKLIAPLAQKFNFGFLDFHIAYLASEEQPPRSPYYQSFKILATLNNDRKKIQKQLKTFHAGSLEIKKRGALIEPEAERKKYSCKGKAQLTLIYARITDKIVVFLCERV